MMERRRVGPERSHQDAIMDSICQVHMKPLCLSPTAAVMQKRSMLSSAASTQSHKKQNTQFLIITQANVDQFSNFSLSDFL